MKNKVERQYKIVRMGNSKGVIIDKSTLEFLELDLDDWVNITIEKIEKAENKKKNEVKN